LERGPGGEVITIYSLLNDFTGLTHAARIA
jgi:hypothetical protein